MVQYRNGSKKDKVSLPSPGSLQPKIDDLDVARDKLNAFGDRRCCDKRKRRFGVLACLLRGQDDATRHLTASTLQISLSV